MRSLLWPLVAAAGLSLARAAPCTEADLGRTYTECVSNTRNAVYFWQNPCEPSDVELPPPVYGLPCDIACDAGTYLPFGERECEPCEKGEYSLGGGEVINTWDSAPANAASDCTGPNCEPWRFMGDYAESGNVTHNSKSNLRLYARFLRPTGNLIRFRFIVDAETCFNCDGFVFYIDDQPMTNLISHKLKWTTLEFNVTQGFHDFRWSYQKDYSVSVGLDRVRLQSIELLGTSYAPGTCSPCPAGTFAAQEASPACTPCNYNQYSNVTRAEECQACLPSQTSFLGATTCMTLPPCEEKHIYYKKTPCTSSKTQNIEAHFATLAQGNVRICDPTHPSSVSLPPVQTNVPCTCPPGQQLDNSGACIFCPEGTARSEFESTCSPCSSGSAALRSLYLADWSSLPERVQTSCQGDCDSEGWIPRGQHIDTGYGAGLQLQSFLSIDDITIPDQGVLELNYTLVSCGSYCDLEVLIENDEAEEVEIVALSSGTQRVLAKPLPKGNYTFTLRYIQTDRIQSDSTKVKLYSISVSGVSEGGATKCVPCPAGYEAPSGGASSCVACQPGFYSPDEAVNCLAAEEGFFTDSEAATRQIACGNSTTSNEERTDCVTDCTFTLNTRGTKTLKYDLNPLYDPESMRYAGTDLGGHQYFLNLCSRNHKNATCYDMDQNPIPTFACMEVSNRGYALDLGHVIGFVPPSEGNTSYFYVTMTEGSSGCLVTYGKEVPRSTKVTMICDTSAGVGMPRAAFGETVEYPTRSCNYHFEWRSLYACPLCTVEDYKTSVSACIDGKKNKTYTRLSDCWDPEPTPPEELVCTSCPAERGEICAAHGSCDDLTGVCNCDSHWAGAKCEHCAIGYFGDNCLEARALDQVAQVVPWWGFTLIFLAVVLIVATAYALWRQRRSVPHSDQSPQSPEPAEERFALVQSVETSGAQPVEMTDADNTAALSSSNCPL